MPEDLLAAGRADVVVFRETSGQFDQWGRCIATCYAQGIREGPKVGAVMWMDDVGDFVPERVQRFLNAMFAVRLPAHHDSVEPWLIVPAIRFARGDDDHRHLQLTLKMRGVQPDEFQEKHFSQSILFRVGRDRWFHRLQILAQVVLAPA